MNSRVQDRIVAIVAESIGKRPADIALTTRVGSVEGWDSIAQLTIVSQLEKEYRVEFEAASLLGADTVSDLVHLVESAQGIAHESTPAADIQNEPEIGDFCSIEERIRETALLYPSKAALVFEDYAVTYGQLWKGMQKAAAWLHSLGVREKDSIALAAYKRKEFFYAYFGAHLLGVSVLNLDSEIKCERLEYILKSVRPKIHIGFGDPSVPYEKLGQAEVPLMPGLPRLHPDAIADIMFTTGTTGNPKGVPLTNGNLAAAALQINRFIGTDSTDVELLALPVCHSFGMGRVRCVLSLGGTLVVVPGFSNVKALFAAMDEYHATGFAFVPAAWAYIRKMSGDAIAGHARHLRYIEIGSAAMEPGIRRHLMELFPETRICMHYGLTEASRSAFIEFHSEAGHLETAGRPAPNVEIAIFSPDGRPLPPEQEGEICIRGKHVAKGYLNQDASECHYGSYFRTGDWGVLQGDGYLRVLSRTKDIINTGGKKVSPEEVERILCSMPGIAEAACVPVADPGGVLGEVVKAVLVSDGTPCADDDAIRAYVASRAEHYKVPTVIEWRDSLPKTDSGKLQRGKMHNREPEAGNTRTGITMHAYNELPVEWLEQLAAVTREAFAEYGVQGINFRGVDMSADLLQRSLARTEQHIFILWIEGKIAGYCRGYIEKKDGYAVLKCEGIAIPPKYRNPMYARMLDRERERWGKAQGATCAVLNTSVKAASAKKFHHANGYKDYGYTHFEGKRYLSVLMRKDYGEPYPEARRRIGLVKSWLLMRLVFTRNGEERLWHRLKDRLLGKGMFHRRGKR